MAFKSQIANVLASGEFRKRRNDRFFHLSHTADMVESDDKNGGPNHLAAWMRFRGIKGAQLATMMKITPGMVSDLVNSNRALNAKWLRRFAAHLDTTPGMLLDHDPFDLDSDIIEIWIEANQAQRRTLADMAKVIVRPDQTTENGDGAMQQRVADRSVGFIGKGETRTPTRGKHK